MRTLATFFLSLLLCCSVAPAQMGHHDPTPQDRDATPSRPLAVPRVDRAQIKRDADELAQLASTVPAEVAKAANGILDKDLNDRLKKIEKLSKRLRSELALR